MTTKTNEIADRGEASDDHSVVNACGRRELEEMETDGSNQEVFSCGVCGMRFDTKIKMCQHMRIHEKFKGKLSGFKSKNSESLQTRRLKHVRNIDNDSDLVTDTGEQRELGKAIRDDTNHVNNKKVPQDGDISKKYKTWKCKVCGMTFRKHFNLKRHDQHHIASQFKCRICKQVLLSRHALQEHFKTSFECSRQIQLQHLNRARPGRGNHVCEVCNKAFCTKPSLMAHAIRMHKNSESLQSRRRKHNTSIDNDSDVVTDTGEQRELGKAIGDDTNHVNNKKVPQDGDISKKYKTWNCNVCGMKFRKHFNLKRHKKNHIASHFKCRICKQVLLSRHALQEHFKTNFECSRQIQLQRLTRARPGRGNHVCEVCNKAFCTKYNLMAHTIRIHRTTNRLTCDVCHKTFKNVESHADHVELHLEKPYMCDTCGKTFARKRTLTQHEQKHTASNLKGNKEKNLLCEDCGASYATKCGLRIHRIRKHLVSKQLLCDLCGQRLPNSHEMSIHRLRHSEDRPFTCNICGKGFKRKKHLVQHKTTHTTRERPFECELCGNDYMTEFALKSHMQTHSSTKHTCDQCGKTYATVFSLKIHAVTHTGDKPYKCSVCGKGFTHHSSRSRHELVHSGEKPYKCDVCGMSFNQSSSLQRHVRLHTGDKPYKCDVCGMDFTQSSSLSGHKRVHHQDHKTDVKS